MNRISSTEFRLSLALTLLFLFVPWRNLGAFVQVAGVLVAVALTVVLPGRSLVQRFFPDTNDRVAFSATAVALGLSFLLTCMFVWALSGVSIDVELRLLPVVSLCVVLIGRGKDASRLEPDDQPRLPGERRLLIAAFALTALVAIAMSASGPMLDLKKDTLDHFAYIEEIAATGDPFPTTAFYFDPGSDGADLRKNLLHAAYGLLNAQTGIGAPKLAAVAGGLCVLALALFVYAAAAMMFSCRKTAATSVILFFLCYASGLQGDMIRSVWYPNRFGVGLLVLCIAWALHAMRDGSVRSLIMTAVLACTATATHIQFAPLVLLGVFVIVIWPATSPFTDTWKHLRRAVIVAVGAGVGVLPISLFRFLTAYRKNDLHEQIQSSMFVTDHWFTADPALVWRWLGVCGIGALLAAVALWPKRRQVIGVGYGIASLVTVLAVLLVPLLFTPFYHALTYLVFRFEMIAPFYMLAAFALVRTDMWPVARAPRRVAVAAAIVIVAGAGVAAVKAAVGNNVFMSSRSNVRGVTADAWMADLERVAAQLPPGSVVASDPVTSYVITGLTSHYTVCTLDQHAPPNDLLAIERVSASRTIMSPFSSPEQRTRTMKSTEATYIIINEDLPARMVLNRWSLSPEDARRTAGILDRSPEFEKAAESGGLSAWRWSGKMSSAGRAAIAPPLLNAPPGSATRIDADAGEATIAGARIGESDVVMGDTMSVALFWAKKDTPVPARYIVSVRFDRVDVALPLGGRPFPKLARKLKEKLEGHRFRFRHDHMPANGLFAPDMWPAGGVVEDVVVIRVPTDLAPGTYRVSVKMNRVAFEPNHHLRDFLYDDDVYAGPEIGSVLVGASSTVENDR